MAYVKTFGKVHLVDIEMPYGALLYPGCHLAIQIQNSCSDQQQFRDVCRKIGLCESGDDSRAVSSMAATGYLRVGGEVLVDLCRYTNCSVSTMEMVFFVVPRISFQQYPPSFPAEMPPQCSLNFTSLQRNVLLLTCWLTYLLNAGPRWPAQALGSGGEGARCG